MLKGLGESLDLELAFTGGLESVLLRESFMWEAQIGGLVLGLDTVRPANQT